MSVAETLDAVTALQTARHLRQAAAIESLETALKSCADEIDLLIVAATSRRRSQITLGEVNCHALAEAIQQCYVSKVDSNEARRVVDEWLKRYEGKVRRGYLNYMFPSLTLNW